ncbi:hypothetical protein DICPUDRAFT_155023 [Dictyostelium purpureum]|uniref:NADPH-dependent diflavin oxidoreductase 1 n=1 Tax=Dictyostelium purpureum TaxID=5786 RepID=F0ZSV6_DICPU|nr:uncharacterized protein DICPUDRAFT_155023 [Dictyostelium purpureum]EGC32987.1 hypothetical protein DICPUDRAFT_155023 [Dictyostelium purpureum]|eukprot:XP_003290505.1 hypothetical protein DICPUDRAFT_155023 [Dictyostelium purpureum]
MINNKSCTILYATESGTSQEVAEKLTRDLIKYDIKPKLFDIGNYNKIKLPEEKVVIFVLSTTGHGDVPDPMKPFWNFLLIKSLPSNSLSRTKFAVLGLGDSSYTTYNFAAKKLYSRLMSLGAIPLLRRGDADDQHDLGIDYEVEKWTKELIDSLLLMYPLPQNFNINDNSILKAKFKLKINKDNTELKANDIVSNKQFSKSKIIRNERITNIDWEQDVRHIELDITEINNQIKSPQKFYKNGDVAYILPRNPKKKVMEFIQLLKLNENWIVESIEPVDPEITQAPTSIITPISVYQLVESYFDILGSPKRYFFELLSYFVENPMEKERLEFFSSAEGQDDLRTYNQKEKRNYIDVLVEFPSANIPFEFLFDLISPIKPRPFSISSSSSLYPNAIHITAGINTYKTPYRHLLRTGLCSQYFQSLELNETVSLFIKESGASLPKSYETPIIMVGPGTGCAMFRSFMQERQYQKESNSIQSLGKALFYFGCRHEAKDYLYRNEFEQFEKNGTITKLTTAFSRDSKDGKKNYVQNYIEKDSDQIWQVLNNENGYFYISGSSGRMPKDIKQTLLEIIKSNLLKNNSDQEQSNIDQLVNNYFEKLEIEKRYITETW